MSAVHPDKPADRWRDIRHPPALEPQLVERARTVGTASIHEAAKRIGALPAAIKRPILVGNVVVHPGDLIVGDADAVVSIPAADAARVVELALARERDEQRIMERLAAGETTLRVYGLEEERS